MFLMVKTPITYCRTKPICQITYSIFIYSIIDLGPNTRQKHDKADVDWCCVYGVYWCVFFGWGAAYKCFHCWVHWLFTVILTVGKDEVSGPDDSSAVRRVQRHNAIKMLCIYTDKYMLHFYTMWRLYLFSNSDILISATCCPDSWLLVNLVDDVFVYTSM